MKIISSSGICNVMYHDRSYFYFKGENDLFLIFYFDNFSHFERAPTSFKRRTLKLKN